MIKTYLKIAFRKLMKNRLYSFVNLTGLTIGIASCLLIGLYIFHELSFDRFNSRANRIVRLTTERNGDGAVNSYATTGTKAGPQLKRVLPAIERYTRTIKYDLPVSAGHEKQFDEKNILFADEDFFSIFSFRLLRGDAHTVLKGPNKVVLTETLARKYFADNDAVDRTLHIGSRDYQVTGICADAPSNSQVKYNMVTSFVTLSAAATEKWSEANYVTYLLLRPQADIKLVEQQEMSYMQSPDMKKDYSAGENEYLIFHMEPLLQVHLYSMLDGLEPNATIMYVYVLGIVALLILFIACVNYTNLAIAQSSSRSIEIGIRKVLGAKRQQLFRQFIGETGLLVFAAIILSVCLCTLLLPLFNQIAGKSFTAAVFLQPLLLGSIILFGGFISLMSGAYPAIILSNTRLISILKSGLHLSTAGGGLRKGLIIFQFVVSVFLMIATAVILQQLSYIRQKDIGYSKDQVIILPVDQKTRAQYQSLKNAIELNPLIKSVSGAYEAPVFVKWGDGISTDAGSGGQKRLSINAMPVQPDFIKTMGMHLQAGSDFTEADFASMDTANNNKNFRQAFIINEKAAKALGWTPEQAIGKIIYKGGPGTIKGVVRDFNYASLHETVGNMVLFPDTSLTQEMYVKVQGTNIAGSIAFLQKIWTARVAYRPFQYRFMDDDYNNLYSTERQSAELFSVFSFIAVLLACLGLFALAAYATVQRTKEIGIRKILGASIINITALVSKEFIQLVAIAILIAAPLALYASVKWLNNFAYRIAPPAWVFAAAGLTAMAIALITVGFHAVRAAMTNPVRSLKSE